MPRASTKNKLDQEQKVLLCRKIAAFKHDRQIADEIEQETGIRISQVNVFFYRQSKKWKPVIEKMREQYLKEVMEVPIAHKRVRLERAEKAFHSAMSPLTRSVRVAKDEYKTEEMVDVGGAISALKQAQVEMEGVVITDRRGLKLSEELERLRGSSTEDIARELAQTLRGQPEG